MGSARASFGLALCVAAIATVWALAVVPYVPTNDGPEHVLQAYIRLHYDDDGTLYRSYLAPLPEFAERGFSIVFVPLLALLEWKRALQVALALTLLVHGLSVVALARALAKERAWVGLLGFALAFGWPLYMGFFPFALGTSAGLALVASVVARPPRGLVPHVLLALGLLMVAVCHVAAAGITGVVVTSVLVAQADAGRRAAALGRVLLVGAPALAVLALAVVSSRGAALPEASALDTVPLATRVQELPRLLAPGSLPRALGLWLVLLAGLGFGAVRAWRGSSRPVERGLLVAALLLVAIGTFGPRSMPGWQHFAPRFLPMGAALAVVLLPVERLTARVPVWAARAVVVLACLLALLGSARLHQRLAEGCADEIAGLDAEVLPRRGLVLPLLLDPYCGVGRDSRTSEVPYLAPLLHLGAAYVASHGGMPAYMFANVPPVHAFRFLPAEEQPPTPERPPSRFWSGIELGRFRSDRAYRHERLERLIEYAVAWDSVVVLGARPADLRQLRSRGFVADWARGSAMTGSFASCPLTVVVPTPSRRGPPVLVDYALDPASPRKLRITVEPADTFGDEAQVEHPRAACGGAFVRLLWDVDRSGGPSPGDRVCRGARADGFRAVELAGPTRVTCDETTVLR